MSGAGLRSLAVAVTAAVLAASTEALDAPAADSAADRLSTRELAGLRLVTGFEGRRPPRTLRRMIRSGDVSGVILFSDNVGGRRAVSRLTARLQAIPRPPSIDLPLLVMADQEGGLVRRLPGPPKPSAAAVGRKGAELARRLGKATGDSMLSMGVNVNLAPVLDIGRPGGAIRHEKRAYGRKPSRVSRVGVAFADGLRAGGVAATAKHFPGLGSARVNTDDAVQRIGLSRAKLRRADERPFVRFADGGGELVMISSAIYPALAGKPASLSRRISTGELRGRLGFAGVSLTDSLDTASGRSFGTPGALARRGARAGTDLLLFTKLSSALKAARALRRALRAGTLLRPGMKRSAERILALRRRLPR